MKRVKQQVKELLEIVKPDLLENDIVNATEYIEYNEFGVAFELICSQLYEYEVSISVAVLDRIKNLAELMELGDSSWRFLEEDVYK